MRFVLGAFSREEHSRLNSVEFALAFNQLACPWVERRPAARKLRARCSLTTVEFTFPWSTLSSIPAASPPCLLPPPPPRIQGFTDKQNRQTIVDQLLKYTCPSFNEWSLIKPRARDWLPGRDSV